MAAGNLVHVVLSPLGLVVIVSQSVLLFGVLKWFGAAYLITWASDRSRRVRADGRGALLRLVCSRRPPRLRRPVRRRFGAVAHQVERATGAVLILPGIRLALTRANA